LYRYGNKDHVRGTEMRTKYRRGLDMVDKPKRFIGLGLLLLAIAGMVMVTTVSALPEYYTALTTAYGTTGNSCGTCHISTGGGGPLTGYGDMFLTQINLGKIPADALKTIGSPNGASTKLSITVPAGVIAVTTGPSTTPKLGKATTSGGVAPVTITNDAPATGFPVGTHTVTWNATDSTGATVSGAQTVTIIDALSSTPAPLTVVVSADVTAVTTGLTTTVKLGNATTSGGTAPISMINDAPEVGFPVGTNTVTWTATDSLGAIAKGTQNVTIVNATPSGPLTVIVPANITNVSAGQYTKVDTGIATTTGGVGLVTIVNNTPDLGFVIGNTSVTWTAVDSTGTIVTGTQTVTITDSQTPTIPVVGMPTVPVIGMPTVPVIGMPTVPEGNSRKDLDDGNKNKDLDDNKVIVAEVSAKVNTEGHSEPSEHSENDTQVHSEPSKDDT
jgi:hypothetical protein